MGIHPGTILGLVRELRVAGSDERSLVVVGTLAEQLARELAPGAAPGAVRTGGSLETAAALVYVFADDADTELLRGADKGGVPIVAVRLSGSGDVPYVLATDVVDVPPGVGFPVEAIAQALAARMGEKGANVARRVPVLRDAVAAELVRSFARKNGYVAAAWFIPGAGMLALTIRQLRLVLRIAHTYGQDVNASRLPEIAGVVASGYGLRGVARNLLGTFPGAKWLVRGTVAYAGTIALGQAAIEFFRRQQAEASRAGS